MKKCGEGAARVSLKAVKYPFDEIMDTKIGHLKLRCSSYLFSCKWHSLCFLIALIGELVISLNLKLKRVYPQLFKEDPEVVHPNITLQSTPCCLHLKQAVGHKDFPGYSFHLIVVSDCDCWVKLEFSTLFMRFVTFDHCLMFLDTIFSSLIKIDSICATQMKSFVEERGLSTSNVVVAPWKCSLPAWMDFTPLLSSLSHVSKTPFSFG